MELSGVSKAASFEVNDIKRRMKYLKILGAEAFSDHTLIVKFSNGAQKKYDFCRLLSVSMFAPLKNPAFFRSFKVEPGGYALVWSEDIDISEYELWKNGILIEDDCAVQKSVVGER